MRQFASMWDGHECVIEVKEGDTFSLRQAHRHLCGALMVHWPEAMVTPRRHRRRPFPPTLGTFWRALDGKLVRRRGGLRAGLAGRRPPLPHQHRGAHLAHIQLLLKRFMAFWIDSNISLLHGPVWRTLIWVGSLKSTTHGAAMPRDQGEGRRAHRSRLMYGNIGRTRRRYRRRRSAIRAAMSKVAA